MSLSALGLRDEAEEEEKNRVVPHDVAAVVPESI